jgi:hypothetical protein
MYYKHYLVKRAQYEDMVREVEKDRLVQQFAKASEKSQPKSDLDSVREKEGWFQKLSLLFKDAKLMPGR